MRCRLQTLGAVALSSFYFWYLWSDAMVAPALSGTFFFWNLSYPVGPGKPNMLDDVELVRYGFNCMRHAQTAQLKPLVPDLINIMAKMRVYGSFDDDLHSVIIEYQKLTARMRDGCIMPSTSYYVRSSQDPPIIVGLNVMMRAHEGDLYPRIDRSIASGAAVSKAVEMFMG
jgi:hypothetical protein